MAAIVSGHAYPAEELPPFLDCWSVDSSTPACTPPSLPRTWTLTLHTIEPEQLDTSIEAAERIRSIRWLQVVARDQVRGEPASYQIQIFVDHSHLHTTTSHPPTLQRPERKTQPDFCISRHATEFHKLRHDLMDAVEGPHETLCTLCTGFQGLLTFSNARPARVAWALLLTKIKLRVLNKLLQGVVGRYFSNLPPARRCQGTHDIPLLLDVFLFGPHARESFSDSVSDISWITEHS